MASDGQIPPLRFDILRRPFRHLREQAKAITDWGLEDRQDAGADVVRKSLPKDAAGQMLSYLTAGSTTVRRVLFIHGSPGHATEWRPYVSDVPQDQC